MKWVHIVGGKNQGKTMFLVEVVGELVRRGMRVGTVKHTPHGHEPDQPGKDSYLHRQAGASVASFIAGPLTAVYFPTPKGECPYERLKDLYQECDLVLVEGDTGRAAASGHVILKFEVWRQALGVNPIARERGDIAGIVTDDPIEIGIPVWLRKDTGGFVDHLLEQVCDATE